MATKRVRLKLGRIHVDVEYDDADNAVADNPTTIGHHWKLGIDDDADGVIDGGLIELTASKGELSFGNGTNYIRVNASGISINPGIGVSPDVLPIGTILMYDGSGILGGDTGNILTRTDEISISNGDSFDMNGWFVCNGQSGTPNLHTRFIRCELNNVGNTGGSNTNSHTHTVDIDHDHASFTSGSESSHTHSGTTNTTSSNAYALLSGTGLFSAYTHTHTFTTGGGSAHNHSIDVPALGTTNKVTGIPSDTNNMPLFYSVIFIKRVS